MSKIVNPFVPNEPHTKKVELQSDSIHEVGSGLPDYKILKNKPHRLAINTQLASLISEYPCNRQQIVQIHFDG